MPRSRKLHQPTRQRTGNPNRIRHRHCVKLQQPAGSDRRTERTGSAGGMEAAPLIAVLRRTADAVHYLEASNDRGDQVTPAAALFLRYSKRGRQQRRARMHAGAGPGQVVRLESMGQRTIG